MTLGQLVECLVGKVAALEGQELDGTPFSKFDLNDIKQRLKAYGYEENGFEYLYNGMTGKKLKSMIFIGPTYYQRLKHMVADKITKVLANIKVFASHNMDGNIFKLLELTINLHYKINI